MPNTFRVSELIRKEKRAEPSGLNHKLQKHRSDTRCPDCGLAFRDGVWKQDTTKPAKTEHPRLCPACRQLRGGMAGGVVKISGSFIEAHRQELLNRIRNIEKLTVAERPLERILSIEENRHKIVVQVTTEHLVARIGKAIQRDFGGSLELKYAPEDKFATATWHRDE